MTRAVAAHQVGADRVHGARPRIAPATAPESTAQDWAIESMLHSSFCAEPSGVPSS